ncbi:MAG: MFS transporter [Actinobacteria bacterium]|nr:MFS transporter [Actinomycetota bacterium]
MPETAPTDPPSLDRGLLRLLLTGAVALISLGAFENLAVTTMMPVVAAELDGLRLYALAMGLPLAAHIAATAAAGLWIDARSLRGPLVWGVVLFVAGLVAAGAAQGMALVAVGRGVSGLGTGLLTVTLYAAVGAIVPPAVRPRFFAAFSAAWVVPSLVGPPLAGYVAQFLTWRLVFLGVAPLALASLLLLRPLLSAADDVAASRGRSALRTRLRTTMVPAVAVAAAVAGLQAAGSSSVVLSLAALVAIAAFLPRLLPPGTLVLRRGIASVVATRLLVNGSVIAMESFLPLLLQRERGWDPGPAGIVLTVGAVTWALGSWIQGRMIDPALRHRAAVGGATLVAAGTAVASLVVFEQVPATLAIVGWVFAGLGMGIVFPSMAVLALATTPESRHGEISAALQIADGVGAALALALVGAGFTALLGTGANPYLPGFAAMVVIALVAVLATTRVPNLTRPALPATPGGR